MCFMISILFVGSRKETTHERWPSVPCRGRLPTKGSGLLTIWTTVCTGKGLIPNQSEINDVVKIINRLRMIRNCLVAVEVLAACEVTVLTHQTYSAHMHLL